MKLHISHGADNDPLPRDWFVVKPLEGQTAPAVAGTWITHDMAVRSLLDAGRAVYEIDLSTFKVTRLGGYADGWRGAYEHWFNEGWLPASPTGGESANPQTGGESENGETKR